MKRIAGWSQGVLSLKKSFSVLKIQNMWGGKTKIKNLQVWTSSVREVQPSVHSSLCTVPHLCILFNGCEIPNWDPLFINFEVLLVWRTWLLKCYIMEKNSWKLYSLSSKSYWAKKKAYRGRHKIGVNTHKSSSTGDLLKRHPACAPVCKKLYRQHCWEWWKAARAWKGLKPGLMSMTHCFSLFTLK